MHPRGRLFLSVIPLSWSGNGTRVISSCHRGDKRAMTDQELFIKTAREIARQLNEVSAVIQRITLTLNAPGEVLEQYITS
jgi:hypothetical protein